jgi:hypothetical protein
VFTGLEPLSLPLPSVATAVFSNITGSDPARRRWPRDWSRSRLLEERSEQDGLTIFHLSETHLRAPTGIETDVQSLQAAWKAMMKVKCPHCGEIHEMSVRETYINGVSQDAVGRCQIGSHIQQG